MTEAVKRPGALQVTTPSAGKSRCGVFDAPRTRYSICDKVSYSSVGWACETGGRWPMRNR